MGTKLYIKATPNLFTLTSAENLIKRHKKVRAWSWKKDKIWQEFDNSWRGIIDQYKILIYVPVRTFLKLTKKVSIF